MIGEGKKGRKTEERQKNLSRSEKGGNRAGSIGGNPSGRVSRFAEREILPVSSLQTCSKSGSLPFPNRSSHTRIRGTYKCAQRYARTHPRFCVLLFRPNRSLSASSGREGDMRLDSSQLHRRFTIQFHLQSVPALRPATRRIDYRSTLVCAGRRKISEGPRKYLASWCKMHVCKQN